MEYGISSMRKTLLEISAQGEVESESNKLKVAGKEIGFVYYRTGYQADHYFVDGAKEWSEEKWRARELLECSMPIKCPSIDLHLATFKKYQQSFSDAELLRRVTGNDEVTNDLKQLFKGIWSLEHLCQEGAEVNQIVELALVNPNQYVLKPQKEGGGNNFFDDELKANLLKAKAADGKDPELSSYIIMERIVPPMIPALMLRNGEVLERETLSEMSLYSSLFIKVGADGCFEEEEKSNFANMLRTKASHYNEGGVAAGYAVIDSPYLVSPDSYKESRVSSTVKF